MAVTTLYSVYLDVQSRQLHRDDDLVIWTADVVATRIAAPRTRVTNRPFQGGSERVAYDRNLRSAHRSRVISYPSKCQAIRMLPVRGLGVRGLNYDEVKLRSAIRAD